MASEKSTSKGQAWFCTTGLPSDIVIEVDDMSFHLHKFPLMSKSLKLHQLITEQETQQQHSTNRKLEQEGTCDEIEEEEEYNQDECRISFPDFPGGSHTFELAAKFCYGVKMELSSSTVAPLRCAGEYLDMTEEYSEDNLVSKTERFLSQNVLKSVKESIKALKSCEKVMPMAESLGIVERCIHSISARAANADPSLFGWPVTVVDNGREGNEAADKVLWNGIHNSRRKGGSTRTDSWFDDLAQLSVTMFKRLIAAMKDRDLNPEIIESCLMYYAKRHIPGISRSNRKQPQPTQPAASTPSSEIEQRGLLETIITNLPLERISKSTTTRFLFGLLRSAIILNASDICRATLEKKIGMQLDQATLDDLLIPSYSYLNETLYDVDCVERILGHFLGAVDSNSAIVEANIDGDPNVRTPSIMIIGKLIDGYLSEIASDANLKPDNFYNLAISLPSEARLFDDGLYRAVDVYLKAHPWLPETEREKICGVMDSVVTDDEDYEEENVNSGGATWHGTVRENQVLRVDMDSMRTRVHQLERECSTMRKVIEKIDKGVPRGVDSQQDGGWKGTLSKKFGCKFKTQVCDSQEQTVVETTAKKGRRRHQLQP
ncbi:hypothetical protein ACFE04_023531 [Oxalis oulophora]